MTDFHNIIMYEAAQLDVSVRTNNGYYFVEGFEIKPLKNKLRIFGWVWLLCERRLELLFETSSPEYAAKALRRTMLVSREISRIKAFPLFANDSRIRIQIEYSIHAVNTDCNFIVQPSKYGNARFQQSNYVELSARYQVPCSNDRSEWNFWIHNEVYMEERLEKSQHWPAADKFTKKRKYASDDFINGTPVDDLSNMYKVGLPYNILAIRVDRVEQYDEAAQEIFNEYGIALPSEKTTVDYIAVKVPKPEFVAGANNPHALGC